MNAAWTARYGDTTVLDVRTLPEPTPGPDELLVQVHASPVTAGDLRLRAADFPGISVVLGRLMLGVLSPRQKVQGTMFAGQVVATGAQVTRFSAGDAVFGSADAGAWAERIVVKADSPIALRPDNVSADAAAAAPYGAGTALHMLRDIAKLQPGEHILILGASGGVGRPAIQVAKHLGARVTAVGSSERLEQMRQLGADTVLDYKTQDFTRSGEQYDVVFDIADRSSFRHSRKSLTPTGRYLSLFISLRVFFWMAATRLLGGKRALFGVAMGDRQLTEDVRGLLEGGTIQPTIAARYPLDRIAEAHAHAEGRTSGVVLVQPTPSRQERSAV